MNTNRSAYNFPMRRRIETRVPARWHGVLFRAAFVALLLGTSSFAQEAAPAGGVTIENKALSPAGLWDPYSCKLEASGGIGPYGWHLVSGTLPRNLELREFGVIEGKMEQQGTFNFTIEAIGKGGSRSRRAFTLKVEAPLTATWSRKAAVEGSRIDGSIKVSNSTGRDFDLTFIVLAVNDIGRATAIGYQHFSLKKNTRDLELPFGDTLAPGNYAVNVDVVGEEPESGMIFRTPLVEPRERIAQGP